MSGSGVKIGIGAELNIGDIQAALTKLRDEINRTGSQIAATNKVKFNPVDKATIDDLKRVETAFERLAKVNSSFRQRVGATGQKGRDFFSLDWGKLYTDPRQAGRAQQQAFEYVTGLGFGAEPHFGDA